MALAGVSWINADLSYYRNEERDSGISSVGSARLSNWSFIDSEEDK